MNILANRQAMQFYYLGERSLYGRKHATIQEIKIDNRRNGQTAYGGCVRLSMAYEIKIE